MSGVFLEFDGSKFCFFGVMMCFCLCFSCGIALLEFAFICEAFLFSILIVLKGLFFVNCVYENPCWSIVIWKLLATIIFLGSFFVSWKLLATIIFLGGFSLVVIVLIVIRSVIFYHFVSFSSSSDQ